MRQRVVKHRGYVSVCMLLQRNIYLFYGGGTEVVESSSVVINIVLVSSANEQSCGNQAQLRCLNTHNEM